MRAPKPGDSPSGYDREIRPRKLARVGEHEAEIRRRQDARWYARMSACLSTDMRQSDDWGPGYAD